MKTEEKETGLHDFYIEEGIHRLANLVLVMINYLQFEYPPYYKEAVIESFPNLLVKADEMSKFMTETTFMDAIQLTDEDIYTFYICYDLVGRLMVSSLYDDVIDGLSEEAPKPEVMKLVHRHTLSNIRPFLQATELYALQTGTLPYLEAIKVRLDRLPVLN